MRILGALALALAGVVAVAPAATAADGGREITRWEETYDLQPDGSTKVTVDIDYDFGNDPGHGPLFTFPVRQGYDDRYDRVYDVSAVSASSSSGAPAKVYLEPGRNWLVVRIGDENIGNVSGVQQYTLSYSVGSVMNEVTDAVVDGGDPQPADEFFLNAIGPDWEIPISDITVTVTSPVDGFAAQCFAGAVGSKDACASSELTGPRATFTHPRINPGEALTVDVLYPPGNFDTAPALIESNDLARAFRATPMTVGGALALLALGLWAIVRVLMRRGRDERYLGVTPGVAPTSPDAATAVGGPAPVVAVQFEPPLGLRPGLLGTLWDERAQTRDVTATMVDLAVRGYLRVEANGKKDYTLVKLREADAGLLDYEITLFDAIFEGRDTVALKDLRTTFAADMAKVQAQLYRAVTNLGWFRGNPASTRAGWSAMGVVLFIAGAMATIFLAINTSLALLGIPLVILAVVMFATVGRAPGRKAEGSRVLAQTKGFELYLATADANQLRFEEGKDLFSRYLPYAIAFGITETWTRKFEELARQGVKVAEPSWYVGPTPGMFWLMPVGIGRAMNQFESMASAAMSAPTPGSTGGGGFSGGGGSSGGGGFGGGGGGW